MEPAQWINGMYNYNIMNLLDIPHFRHSKNVGFFIKPLFSILNGVTLWMDRPILIDVALITKIRGFPTVGAKPQEYLENKVCRKQIVEIVKALFGTNKGNGDIILKYVSLGG
jgi:hypothetical protein